MAVRIEVIHADGRLEHRELEGERLTVGRSREASVPVDAPEFEPLHLLVLPGASDCWISSARGAGTEVLYEGKPFDNGRVPWGAEMDIGSVTVRVVKQDSDRMSRYRLLIALSCCALLLPVLTSRDGERSPPRTKAPAPALVPDGQEIGCSSAPDRSAERAEKAADEATSRETRYPFDAREGVAALRAYAEAAACAEEAGAAGAAAELRERASRLQSRVEADYRAYQIGLARALGAENWREAWESSRQLLSLLAHRDGEYVEWLVRLERYLDMEIHTVVEKKSL